VKLYQEHWRWLLCKQDIQIAKCTT
jgi:hypothetical protein